jgi:methionyl-tRNA synthetase
MSEPFYITTPIYYVNDEPHLGHAYTTVVADVLARYAHLRGREVFFLTGTDEHGQKVQQAVQNQGVGEQAYVDGMVERFRGLWRDLHIDYQDFIRTTEPRHVRVVQTILQRLWDQGEIYKGDYVGWYCVPDERFWTEKDLEDGNCPDCGRPVEQLSEPNYFFRMSTYQDWLIGYINDHPAFIQPETRRNEVLGYLQKPLGDLCISRPTARLSWGIPLPFDEDYVTYVWFDALINYVTAPGYLSDRERFDRYWPQVMHLIGKDILITHCVYWPTMLKAAGLSQPRTIFAHGWWTIEGEKMSKSRGNVVKPLALAQAYGVDAFRYFLLREMTFGRDADFSEAGFVQRYESELANDLGNLLHRIVNMIGRYCNGRVPEPQVTKVNSTILREQCQVTASRVLSHAEHLRLNTALTNAMDAVNKINGYLEETAPWSLARQRGRQGEVDNVLYTAAEALRLVSVLLWPVLPERITELWRRLGWAQPESLRDGLQWGALQPGTEVVEGPPLFPREVAQERVGELAV